MGQHVQAYLLSAVLSSTLSLIDDASAKPFLYIV
jgi:hypothetical protein